MAASAQADTLRIATYAAPLSRDGPGLLLRDIGKGDDPELIAIADRIDAASPDVLVLTDFDYDLDGHALRAFEDMLADDYAHQFALMPNAGIATGLDIDGNGRTGDARDAQGYGRFAGDGGIAVLSRYPIDAEGVADFSKMLWRDLSEARLPQADGANFFSQDVRDILRLSSAGHWIVPITLPDDRRVSVLVFAATPPVFDGPEDMNGLRARDELRLWEHVLNSNLGERPDSFVLAGLSNLDPNAGEGDQGAMAAFLARPDLQDAHQGTTNADWGPDSAGKLRVSYVLPSRDWRIVDASPTGPIDVFAGPHALVWVDISR